MSFSAFSAGFFSGAGLIVAIGAQNAFVLRQSLAQRHVGLVVSLCALSDILFILCGVAGIEALVSRWPGLLIWLRFGGAAFLAAYGAQAAWRAWRGQASMNQAGLGAAGRRRVILTCLAFTFLNPHVYLDTMVLLGSLAAQYAGLTRWVFAAGACAASVAWFVSLGYGARLLAPLFRRPAAWRVLDALVAVFMLALCLLLLVKPLR
ncbi:LysE/ArgO family amino acid transporter [Kerstersia sp.]|uniref:LysE/ArgO family amino acid transporter n=1 Tax=Kerstersia sp. TaxID=1930783 RepID=UPI003F9001C5